VFGDNFFWQVTKVFCQVTNTFGKVTVSFWHLPELENAKRYCHLLLCNFRLLWAAKMPKEFVTLLTAKG
jgi:hypothetical protein